jgi:hypothetical protein
VVSDQVERKRLKESIAEAIREIAEREKKKKSNAFIKQKQFLMQQRKKKRRLRKKMGKLIMMPFGQ